MEEEEEEEEDEEEEEEGKKKKKEDAKLLFFTSWGVFLKLCYIVMIYIDSFDWKSAIKNEGDI